MFLNDTSKGQTVTSFSGSVTGNGSHSTGSIDVIAGPGRDHCQRLRHHQAGWLGPAHQLVLYTPATGVDLDGFFCTPSSKFDGKKDAPASWLVST